MQMRLAQVVYTLTQFPTVSAVRFSLDGAPVDVFSSEGIVLDHPVGRTDYEDLLVGTAARTTAPLAGSWHTLARSPLAVDDARTSVWTGTELLLVGRHSKRAPDGAVLSRLDVAAAYDPAKNVWRRLPFPPGSHAFMKYSSVWTGKEMIVWGQGIRDAFNPATNQWRRLPDSKLLSIHDGFGLVAWTGREMLGWGGGCCGDAFSDGVAYNPAANTWRALPQAPLPGSQHPIGAWTGRELVVFVGTRAAAYNPATNQWRRIAPLPAPRDGATAVWDGTEVLVVGGASKVGFAYDPASNRWRRLPPMESPRFNAATVWNGKQLLIWGGSETADGGAPVIPAHGLAYDPRANRWSPLPQAPLRGRLDPTGGLDGPIADRVGRRPAEAAARDRHDVLRRRRCVRAWGMKALLFTAVAAAVLATPVLACGDGWMGENLVVTPTVKTGLRSAYLAAHPSLRPSRVNGPISGQTYYGSYSGTRYALATFTTGLRPRVSHDLPYRLAWAVARPSADTGRDLHERRSYRSRHGLVARADDGALLRCSGLAPCSCSPRSRCPGCGSDASATSAQPPTPAPHSCSWSRR